MYIKKITFLASLFTFFIAGCGLSSRVTFKSTQGDKYIFKKDAISCRFYKVDNFYKKNFRQVFMGKKNTVYCEGSFIIKNIAGNIYVERTTYRKKCWDEYQHAGKINTETLICRAADELGMIEKLIPKRKLP